MAIKNSLLPEEIKALPHWTTHTNRRPHASPDQWANGETYEQVKSRSNDIGVLIAPAEVHPYLFIDIDYPDEAVNGKTKEDIVKAITDNNIQLGSQEHLELIQPTLDSIKDLSLYSLMDKTYTEFSPSGTGIRMIIQSQDKAKYPKAYKKASLFKGQIDFKNQFITITENAYPGTTSNILEVPLLSLSDSFGFKQITKIEPKEQIQEERLENASRPKPQQVIAALKQIPLDQNPRIKRIWQELTEETYEHYYFWLYIGMALHDYSKDLKNGSTIYKAWLEWSETDPVGYTGEESVYEKWLSFNSVQSEPNITWKTIIKIANKCAFDYPKTIINKKGIDTGLPQINEWDNFKYLLDFYDIKLYEDDAYYITGEKDICEKYFIMHGTQCWFDKYYGPLTQQGLETAMLILCQASKWKGLSSTRPLVTAWVNQPKEQMDLFETWLNTPYNELPEEFRLVPDRKKKIESSKYNHNSNVDYIFKCLNVQAENDEEEALAKSMFKKTLMQMIKFREPMDDFFTDNGGMLILVGAENTYKSTFFKMLLPKPLDALRKEMNMQLKGEKSIRDFIRYLGNKSIIQLDEFEGIMDQKSNGSLFKAVLSGDTASMTDIFQTNEIERPRKAIIVATTNEHRQIISDNGSRRLWFVKVGKINTSALLNINLHKLYNDLRDEFRTEYKNGHMPWLLSQEEINLLYKTNEKVAAKSDLDLWLDQIFHFESEMPEGYIDTVKSVQTDTSGKLFSTRAVIQALEFHGMHDRIKLSQLERVLERKCGKYTQTYNNPQRTVTPRGILVNGKWMQGLMDNGKYKYTRWVMPPMFKVEEVS